MSQAVTTGLFALGGVLIGGLLDYAITSVGTARQHARAMRTAARLVAEDMLFNEAVMHAAVELGMWTPIARAPLRLQARNDNSATLAADLSYDEWRVVRMAVRRV